MILIYYSGGWCWWPTMFWGIDILWVIHDSWVRINYCSLSVRSTVRTWDLNSEKKHKSVFKPRSFQGKKVTPTCCTYSRDGKLIAAGCQDGTIQIWDRNLSVSLKTCTYQPPQCAVGCKHRMSVLLWPRAESHETQVVRSQGTEVTVQQVTDQHWPELKMPGFKMHLSKCSL